MLRTGFCFCGRILSQNTKNVQILSAGYKSRLTLEKLYPDQQFNFTSQPPKELTEVADKEFTGYIPVDKLDFRYSRSSGPGGQNVNKVNSKVEARFHVASADWIPEKIKPELLQQQKGKLTKDGYLIVTSERTRKQFMNQADCMDKIRQMIIAATIEPYEPTEEEIEKTNERKERARRNILKEKRNHSRKKQARQGNY